MNSDPISRIEDEHERIDLLLDRISAARPTVDQQALRKLEHHLTTRLQPAYVALWQSASGPGRGRLQALSRRPGEWTRLLRSLNAEEQGTPRWWIRFSDLEHRIRRQFSEVENELLDLPIGGTHSAAENRRQDS